MLTFTQRTANWDEEWREEYEERAGILEFMAGLTRAKAEEVAFWMVHERRRIRDAVAFNTTPVRR